MRLEFNRLAEADIFRILDYYEGIGGPELADEFYGELREFLDKAAKSRKPTPSASGIFAG